MRYGIAQRPFVQQWRIYLFVLLLAAVTILAYRPAWNGGFLWDDDAYVTNNELLTAPDGLRRIWFSLEYPSSIFRWFIRRSGLSGHCGVLIQRAIT